MELRHSCRRFRVSNTRQAILAGIVIAICAFVIWRAFEAAREVRMHAGAETGARYVPDSQPLTSAQSEIPAATYAQPTAILKIATDETAANVVREVERVTRPKHAAFAVFGGSAGRLACLLVDYPDRYYQLDYDLKPESFALLKSSQFSLAPAPVLKSISIYRSLAKRAMGYRATGEDRLMIVLCPEAEWNSLDLKYDGFKSAPLPGDAPAEKPAF